MSISENILAVRQKIVQAAVRVNRNPADIKLVAVTKTVEPRAMQEALTAGIQDFAENRVQELVRKHPYFEDQVSWHLIGHLQTNKVKQVIGRASMVHSLDRLNLARELSGAAQAKGLVLPVLLQVNISREDTKYGLAPEEVLDFVAEITAYPGLSIQGLMTMAPLLPDPEETRPVFRDLTEMAHRIKAVLPAVEMRWLSMGMTNDYEVAVEEGANLVRIGSGIFGPRN